jgi:hypothetical protein
VRRERAIIDRFQSGENQGRLRHQHRVRCPSEVHISPATCARCSALVRAAMLAAWADLADDEVIMIILRAQVVARPLRRAVVIEDFCEISIAAPSTHPRARLGGRIGRSRAPCPSRVGSRRGQPPRVPFARGRGARPRRDQPVVLEAKEKGSRSSTAQ